MYVFLKVKVDMNIYFILKKLYFLSVLFGGIIYISSWIINFLVYNVLIYYDYLFMWYGYL